MATQVSWLTDDQIRGLQIDQKVHYVKHEFPGGCWKCVVTAVRAGGAPVATIREPQGKKFRVTSRSAGLHFPGECPFGKVKPLEWAS